MSQISERNLDNLAKSHKIPYIIFFGDSPSSGPQLSIYTEYQDQNPGKILIVYSNERAEHFTNNCDTRIGTHLSRWKYWPQSKGTVRYQTTPPPSDSNSHTSGLLFGSMVFRVNCGFHLITSQNATQQKNFTSREMEKHNLYSTILVDSDGTPPSSIELYFEVSVILIAEYSKARIADKDDLSKKSCTCVERTVTRWYEDNSSIHKYTCFDNPYGAFTNFTIQFPAT